MSTDLPLTRTRSDQRQRFQRISLGLIVVLAVIAGGLGAANAAQGPRLSSAEVNPHALITRAGQRLLLHTNQPLSGISPDQVQITPVVPNDVTVDHNTVTIRFTTMLNYNTNYTVTINTRGAATGIAGRIEYAFSTPDVNVYSLLRDTSQDASGQDLPDRILRHSLAGPDSNEVVFEAPRIQEYLTLRDLLAVVALDQNDLPSLIVTSPSDGTQTLIRTPGARTIRKLHSANTGDLFGYILDGGYEASDDLRNTLFLYDLAQGTGVAKPVLGFGGNPLTVSDWTFVPGTTSIVVQGEDQQLYLIDPLASSEPTPLGRHAEMRGFVPGTVQLVVSDPLSDFIIDLAAGTTTALNLPQPQTSPDLYPGKLVMLTEDSYVQLNTEIKPNEPSTELTSALVLTDPSGSRELYRTASPGSPIRNFCLSPNGEYLAVEVTSGEGIPDNYPVVIGYSATSVYFVRLDDGTSNRGVNGFLPDWCGR